MSEDRLKNWLERQKNKQYRPKRSISPKDESNDDSVSEEGAIRKAQIEKALHLTAIPLRSIAVDYHLKL